MDRIFLNQALYDIDDIHDSLILVLKDGDVSALKIRKDLDENIEFFSFWNRTYDGINDFNGIKYYSVCELEDDIGIAYDVENEDLIETINNICMEANLIYYNNMVYFKSLLKY